VKKFIAIECSLRHVTDMNVISKMIANRYRPLIALDAIRKLIRDKEDTTQVFRLLYALKGGSFEKNFKRFQTTELGARVLANKLNLVDVLCDRPYLTSLPQGSLGAEFLAFMDGCGITPQGLNEAASDAGLDEIVLPEDAKRYAMRVRVQHDLWHVVAGYGCDGFGETCNVAYSYPHTNNIGFMVIAVAGAWNYSKAFPGEPIMAAMWQGLKRGRATKWLPGTDWEAMLPLPLAEVRRQLNITELPSKYLAAPRAIEQSFTASPIPA
jgi:ubiquinone biosynthesis protein COQ4